MKIFTPEYLKEEEIMRKAGYGLINTPHSGPSFVRRMGTYNYPRFHAYIQENSINLHLDQKQVSYESAGTHAHSGEYEGDTVEREADRIKEIMDAMAAAPKAVSEEKPEKKGLLGKWF